MSTFLIFLLGLILGILVGIVASRAVLEKIQTYQKQAIEDLKKAAAFYDGAMKSHGEALAFHQDASNKYDHALKIYREVRAILPDLPGQRKKDDEWQH